MTSLRDVLDAVLEVTGVTRAEFYGITRARHVTDARHMFVALARKKTNRSLPEIGRWYGKDHTTVLNSQRRAQDLMTDRPGFKPAYDRARALIDTRAAAQSFTGNANRAPTSTGARI